MSHEETIPATPEQEAAAHKAMTEQLVNTFQLFLHSFMHQQGMTTFGPNDHIHRKEDETGIYVSYIMLNTGHIQMTTTIPHETLQRYMSFSAPEQHLDS